MVYVYEDHLGGLFVSDEYIEDTYCNACGDSDQMVLVTEDMSDVRDFLRRQLSVFNMSGYTYEYLLGVYRKAATILKDEYFDDCDETLVFE